MKIQISLKFVLKGPVDNKPSLIQIMGCPQRGNRPLFELMMASFNEAYISVTRLQWV